MDNITLPTCAQWRQTGTVITKPKDDYRRISSFTEKCELCGRTRISSQYSDCDSDTVKKCRPHRSSTTRSRYVNVCAAVCLLLLVGDLSPSSAAPRPRRDKMENPAWGNPCDLADGPATSSSKKFDKDNATAVAKQAKAALDFAQEFKDKFAKKLQSYDAFNEISDVGPWLQSFTFDNQKVEDVFPKDKNKIDKEMSAEHLNKVTENIDEKLPVFYKALKMVVAGLFAIKENGLQPDIQADKDLKQPFENLFHRVRQVLCLLNEVMLARNLEIPPLMNDEIPSLQLDRIDTMYMIYRDTMLYLDFLRQVMNHCNDTDCWPEIEK